MDPADPERIIRHLIAEGYLTTDGEMLMAGTEAERVFGRSNWKDLYSVILGGGEYRAITPDGEMVGKLDARFVNSHENGEVTLGGRSYSMVKCDDDHDIVVVVPGNAESSRTFWTGSTDEGYSPLVCRKIRAICARGRSVLPLPAPEAELLDTLFLRLPPELGRSGLAVTTRKGTRGREILIFSFEGSRFNRILSRILEKRLGRGALVRYDDFVVRVQRAGKEDAADRVRAALESIRLMERSRIASALPLPPPDGWKFARVLPHNLFAGLVVADYYHLDQFLKSISEMEITMIASASPLPAPGVDD
jgi:ATP-dependent Lhr-like helicase